METTSDHLDHQVLLKNDCERICVGYKPDGVLGNQLNHQLHSEHGNDIRIKIADITSFYPSGKPSEDMNMRPSEKIRPICALMGPTLIPVGEFVQKYVDLRTLVTPSLRIQARSVYIGQVISIVWICVSQAFSILVYLVYSSILSVSVCVYMRVHSSIQAVCYYGCVYEDKGCILGHHIKCLTKITDISET